jgi:hypothetical protein
MTDVQDMPELQLPPQFTRLRRLLRVLGGPATLSLLRHCGGRFLKVPEGTDTELVALIGADNVRKLTAEFGGGERIMMPMPDKIEAKIRNAAIWAEMDQGVSAADQSSRYHLTTRQVINIRNMRRRQAECDIPSPQSSMPF